jgi:hypothetical protein
LSPSLSPPPCGIEVPEGHPSAFWVEPPLLVLVGGELEEEPQPVSTPPMQTIDTKRSARNGRIDRILTRYLLR